MNFALLRFESQLLKPFLWPWPNEEGTGTVSGSIITDKTKFWAPNEWAGYKIVISGIGYNILSNTENTITFDGTLTSGPYDYRIAQEVEIDYGDVLVFKGSFYSAKAGILVITAYNLSIDIDKIVSLANTGKLDIQKNIIDTYKSLLTLLPEDDLSEAKEAFGNPLDSFNGAIDSIKAESDDQTDDLFVIEPPNEQDPCNVEETRYRNLFTDLKAALSEPTFVRFEKVEVDSGCVDVGIDLNLYEFFDNPKELRYYLPTFIRIAPETYILRDSFSDPTFGGILPSMTSEGLDQELGEIIRDSLPISTPVLYDNFSAPSIETNKWKTGESVRELIQTGDYVYDNFSGSQIDEKKWNQWEFVREIKSGKLLSKVFAHGSEVNNYLNFKNPDPITYIGLMCEPYPCRIRIVCRSFRQYHGSD